MTATKEVASGIVVGQNKGHIVKRLPKRVTSTSQKGRASKRVLFVREVIKEVAGLAPYEKRAIEMLKINKDKRCLKFLKTRLGAMKRAKRKREELNKILLAMKRRA